STVASCSDTSITSSPCNAAIRPKLPASTRSAAFSPKRVASTRSRGVGDPPLREQLVAELVDLALVLGTGQLTSLAHDDDREVLAAGVPLTDLGDDLVDVDGPLGDE